MLANFSRLTLGHYIALAMTIGIVFYFSLAGYPLSNNNEGLYAEIAREMFLSGNYLVPHLNFVPYIEKPPLLYWLISGSYHIFGVTVFAARFITATCGALTVICLCWLGHKIDRAVEAWLAAIMLATSIGFIVIARIVFFDMLLTVCLTFTLSCFYLWWRSNKKYYLFIAYIFLALAVLAKGMLSLILVPAICISFLLICKQKNRITALFNPIGLLLFLAVVLPWHIMASLKHPGFAWEYFINEQILRFLNDRMPHDYYQGPIYYYIPRILIYAFPWSLFIPALFKRNPIEDKNPDKLPIFLALWVIVPLIFFSISQAKANYYMIISMPALVFLLSIKIHEKLIKKELGIFIGVFGVLTAIFAGALIYFSIAEFNVTDLQYQIASLLMPWLYGLLIIALVFLVLSIIFYASSQQELNSNLFQVNNKSQVRNIGLLAGVCGLSLVILMAGCGILKRIPNQYAELSIINYLKVQPSSKPIYYYDNYAKQSTLLFYLQRRLPIIDTTDSDMAYGSQTPAAKDWFISFKQFKKLAKKQACYVALTKESLADFINAAKGMHFCPVSESGKGILLSNDQLECKCHDRFCS